MNPVNQIAAQARQLIQQGTGVAPWPCAWQPVSGGCINKAWRLESRDQRWFVKWNAGANAQQLFHAETQGLQWLRRTRFRIPEVVGQGTLDDGSALLVMEWIEPAPPMSASFEMMGRQLALMHRDVQSDQFGLAEDNFIGTTPQSNRQSTDWIQFFREQRLGPQLSLAFQNGLIQGKDRKVAERFLTRLDQRLVQPPLGPSLLHGDLWNGNFLIDREARPVLIDPAVYFGHSEAEFGIILLFGGFPKPFFDAYREVLPADDGFATRVEVYKLYHLLNHLNLFGPGYLQPCLSILGS